MLKLIVRQTRQASPLIRSLRLAPAEGAPLPSFGPGAHLKIHVPGLAEPRCYSLMGFAAADFEQPGHYQLGVRLEDNSQGGSRHMHALAEGDVIEAEPPRNDFPLHAAEAGEAPVVLIAGGIGITPIAAMAATLAHAARPYRLHYCGRSRAQLAFLDELRALAGDALAVHADDENPLDLAGLLAQAGPASHVYVCGPKGLIDAVIAATGDWPEGRVHFELFTPAAAQEGDQAFEVELRQSGKVLTVPADKTILDVLEAAGCDPLYDCKRGECGVCQATVLEGLPDHRDYYLSEAEKAGGQVIQVCISRSKTPRLVLDL
ncbi:PDR/VanB family oxidoreductase [Bordetella pseudohinzii]|uniref:Ferredoxin n=1 Tax=Bordetella pseudohinzii TaxID=1331258 RepID=A0A0J6C4M1_9BORD|nr:PDR/VanB family oxidoreductase [Bordetella pseudohinzii]ANY17458.1 ferredoxin [Bordetella pseudohinzii]KMM25681.1 ferredoxin [Bordetella pseudohinzii]KXA81674.1 ferredoxin [Bordetella pseudohinzii]KXA83087.1 ferredoxin [Bordetella pseudohinzii]CUI71580.1 Phthalate dioxygenase reductase [Bordetella pseudohinzii]